MKKLWILLIAVFVFLLQFRLGRAEISGKCRRYPRRSSPQRRRLIPAEAVSDARTCWQAMGGMAGWVELGPRLVRRAGTGTAAYMHRGPYSILKNGPAEVLAKTAQICRRSKRLRWLPACKRSYGQTLRSGDWPIMIDPRAGAFEDNLKHYSESFRTATKITRSKGGSFRPGPA